MRVAGVKVGSVDSATIDPKTYQAVVGLTVRDDLKLPKDSSAVITSESLLGGKYLALTPGGDDAMLQPGQTITITQGSINIEELLGKFIFSASSLATSAARAAPRAAARALAARQQWRHERRRCDQGGHTGAGGGGLPPLGGPAGGKSP